MWERIGDGWRVGLKELEVECGAAERANDTAALVRIVKFTLTGEQLLVEYRRQSERYLGQLLRTQEREEQAR